MATEGRITIKRVRPTKMIFVLFLFIILIGSFFLSLPMATVSGEATKYVDALFMSTSSLCVVGITLFDTASYWSPFGKFIILVLVQIGGIGLMTVVIMFALLSGKKITLSQRMIIKDTYNLEGPQGMVRLVQYIVQFTLITEAAMAILLAIRLRIDFPFLEAVYKGVFISISAFCNAGFDTFGTSGMSLYRGDIFINTIVIILIVMGGIGFPVLMDMKKAIGRVMIDKYKFKRAISALDLHTKIALSMSLFLIVFPAIVFFISETANSDTCASLPIGDKLVSAVFQSVSMRTAGFSTIDQEKLTFTSKILSLLLMFIGGSPSGTAGGIKTVTLGVLLAAVYSVVRGYDNVRLFGRKISYQTVQKALAVYLMGQAAVIISLILLSVSEVKRHLSFYDLLHLAISAFSTTGTAQTASAGLTEIGKLIIIVVMIIGRLGPITVTAAITEISSHTKNHFDHPEGRIIIG